MGSQSPLDTGMCTKSQTVVTMILGGATVALVISYSLLKAGL